MITGKDLIDWGFTPEFDWREAGKRLGDMA